MGIDAEPGLARVACRSVLCLNNKTHYLLKNHFRYVPFYRPDKKFVTVNLFLFQEKCKNN